MEDTSRDQAASTSEGQKRRNSDSNDVELQLVSQTVKKSRMDKEEEVNETVVGDGSDSVTLKYDYGLSGFRNKPTEIQIDHTEILNDNHQDKVEKSTKEVTTKDEKRMEMNRQRAKDIRKRKKKMLEDMQQQIIFLTLENNKLRTQCHMQQAELNILRNFSPVGGGAAGITNNKMSAMLGNSNVTNLSELLSKKNDTTPNVNDVIAHLSQKSLDVNDIQQRRNLNAVEQLSRQQGNSAAALLQAAGLTNQQSLPPQLLSCQNNSLLGNSHQHSMDTTGAEHNVANTSLAARSAQLLGDTTQSAEANQQLPNSLANLLTNTQSNLLNMLNSQQLGQRESALLQILLEQQRKQNEKNNK